MYRIKYSHRFDRCFAELPIRIQRLAVRNFDRWLEDPSYPSLHFKKIKDQTPLVSLRIGRDYRALGEMEGDTVRWFWIGHHRVYDRLLGS